jgi:hypothetical protein
MNATGAAFATPVTAAYTIARTPEAVTEPTPLQSAFEAFAIVVDQLERLPGRQRAVALDLAHRCLARALVEHRALLSEWELAA